MVTRSLAFLTLLVAIGCGTPGTPPAHPSADQGNVFTHDQTGFTIVKPDGWVFCEVETMDEHEGSHIAVWASESPAGHGGDNPAVKVMIVPSDDFTQMDPVRLMQLLSPMLVMMWGDFAFVDPVQHTTVDEQLASYMSASYTAPGDGGAEIPSTAKLWIVPYGENLVMVSMTASDEGFEEAQDDFDGILESIAFD